MFAEWNDRAIIVTKSANNELLRDKLTMEDVVEILEKGFDCPRSKRAKDTVERCLNRSYGTIKVVVVESVQEWSKEKVWILTHVKLYKGGL
ncbi:MAG: hypothetical protein JSW28_00175 [Thermoplasmata archaeon]|nr:MAG: hypothetical protein JSW28_00175 [Thermoplasmata archaeon]